jgi:hypothetical protein
MSENAYAPAQGTEEEVKTNPGGTEPDHLSPWGNQPEEIGKFSPERAQAYLTNSLITQAMRVGTDAMMAWLFDQYRIQGNANGCMTLTTDQVIEERRIYGDAAYAWLSARVNELADEAKDYMHSLSAWRSPPRSP